MKQFLQIGVSCERSRAHGRALLEGLAEFARTQYDWRLNLLETEQLTNPAILARFDGFIVRVMDDATACALRALKKPVIDIYGRQSPIEFTTLNLDDSAIAKMALDFFVDRLFTSVAYCGFPGLRFSDARAHTFINAATARKIRCITYAPNTSGKIKDTFFRTERADRAADEAALKRWLKSLPKPIAVFCCNDLRALHIMKCCEDLKINVPRDVAVLGVDNDTLLCSFTSVPLSSIDTRSKALGRCAGELLSQALSGDSEKPRLIKHPPRRVLERASTDVFQFSIPWLSDALVFIRQNLNKGVNASDVVRHLGYSHTTVNKAFNAELGTTVQQEIIRQRLAFACKQLKETNDSAGKISADAGFQSPQYFSKVFYDTYHQTPDVWRHS